MVTLADMYTYNIQYML